MQLTKDKAEQMIDNEGQFKTIYWLNCASDLLMLGFSKEEIQNALDKVKYKVEDLTDEKDFENGCYHQKKQLIKDYHTSNYIRVYETIKKDGQYIKMEGYKTGSVQTFRVPATYQGLKHEMVIRAILKKRFSWFKKLKWDINELRGYENAEIYLKTEFGSLYVPLVALLKKDYSMIEERMISYYKDYRLTSSYELNKNKGESLDDFKKRKVKEYEKDIKPLMSKEAKRLKVYLK